MSDDELPIPTFCGEDCPFMVRGCEDFCPVKAYGSEVAARAREGVFSTIEQLIPIIFSGKSRKWTTGNGFKQDFLCMIKRLRSGVSKE